MVFKHATDDDDFFDTPLHIGEGTPVALRDPFHLPTGQLADSLHAFTLAQRTNKAIAAVSRDWRKHSYALLFRHIVIKRAEQLELLLNLLETSLSSSKFTVALGWWVTHIKFHSFENIPPSHINRLFACCPRIQVLIDATPYGLHQTSYDILVRSLPQNAPIKSLDWTFGGPDPSYFLNSPSITNNLISLRCMTCQFPSNILPHPPISFDKLQYIELFLSPETFSTWSFFAQGVELPSLIHCALRTSTSRSSISMEGTRALESFLRKFGAQLRVLTLRVCPGDDMSWGDFAETDEEKDRKSTRLNSSHLARSRMPSSA